MDASEGSPTSAPGSFQCFPRPLQPPKLSSETAKGRQPRWDRTHSSFLDLADLSDTRQAQSGQTPPSTGPHSPQKLTPVGPTAWGEPPKPQTPKSRRHHLYGGHGKRSTQILPCPLPPETGSACRKFRKTIPFRALWLGCAPPVGGADGLRGGFVPGLGRRAMG